jgi:protein phosphatase
MFRLELQFGSQSVTGNYRENNEDRVYADAAVGLFLVADGMGGQLAGEQASQMAVDLVPDLIEAGLKDVGETDDAVAKIIRKSVLDANQQIMDLASRRIEFQSMGTTIVLALFHGQSVYVAGLGDSRAYLVRGGHIKQLTIDHSLAQALVEARTISAKEAREHRFRNILWKYLGSKEVGSGPDVSVIDAAGGDRFLLASDGLTGVVNETDLLDALMNQPDPQKAVESLVTLALQNDSHDNVSCIAIYLE